MGPLRRTAGQHRDGRGGHHAHVGPPRLRRLDRAVQWRGGDLGQLWRRRVQFGGLLRQHVLLAGPSQSAVIDFSTGDLGAPGEFPAYSPNVVAVGGTSLYTLSGKGAYGTEIGWSGSGGGASQYLPTPSYQSSNGVNFGSRSNPDVSIIADPNTGVWIYDSYYNPSVLIGIGGTSLACPVFSGMVAITDAARAANNFGPLVSDASVSNSIQAKMYADYNSSNYLNDFHDVTSGSNGHSAGLGYDLVTGIGTPKVNKLVATLSSSA